VLALSVDEVAELSCLLLETDVMSDELARHLHAQTAGIPFALEELVRMHRDKLELVDSWQTVEELDDLAVPPAVRQSLRERMASLPSDAWLVTRAAAVLGAPAGEELIRSVAGLSAARAMKGLGGALKRPCSRSMRTALKLGETAVYGSRPRDAIELLKHIRDEQHVPAPAPDGVPLTELSARAAVAFADMSPGAPDGQAVVLSMSRS